MKKTVFKKGFTLIELMIVIVILGVLMGTILPRLTGAQARARDTGRIADLNTIGQALETYFDDNGKYPAPAAATGVLCLTTDSVTANIGYTAEGKAIVDGISSYLKGNMVPTPAKSQVTTAGTASCKGGYGYIPLRNKGIAGNGYALFSDVETYQKSNLINADLIAGVAGATPMSTDDVDDIAGATTTDKTALSTADTTLASSTIYVHYN